MPSALNLFVGEREWRRSVAALFATLVVNVMASPYNAKGDGVTDDTAAIQAAAAASGVGGTIYLPPGAYLISATIVGLPNQQWIGAGVNSTKIYRTGDFGHTLSIGTTMAPANAVRVEGIWFQHGAEYTSGDTVLANKATSGAHLHVLGAQFVEVKNNWFHRLTKGIHLDGPTLANIERNDFVAVWDNLNVGCQEGIAFIHLDNAFRNPTTVKIKNNIAYGVVSASRTLSYVTADNGTQTISAQQPIGPQFGVLVYGCEDLTYDDNYLGGPLVHGLFGYLQPGSVNLEWRVSGGFFDGVGSAGSAAICIGNVDDATYLNGLIVNGVNFNGEGTQQWHVAISGVGPNHVVRSFTFNGNTCEASVGAALNLPSVRSGVISGNALTGYNARNLSNTDPTYVAAALISGNSAYITVGPNRIGGSVNDADPTNSYCYQGIVVTSSAAGSIFQRHNDSSGTGASGAQTGKQDKNVVAVSTSSTFACAGNEDVLVVKNTGSSALTGTWPAKKIVGTEVTIKDGSGTAGTHSMTIADPGGATTDGAASVVISTDYGKVKCTWNGSEWSVL